MTDVDALASEVGRLRRELHALQATVAQLSRRRDSHDGRLGEVLRLVYGFAGGGTWPVSELLADAARAAPDLWRALDALTGSRGDSAVRLGLWLARQAGIEADGLRLERVRIETGAWTYRVTEAEGQPLQPPLRRAAIA